MSEKNHQQCEAAERIYHAWDEALGKKDVDAAMKLYTEDCRLESPLVRHLMSEGDGIVTGRDHLRAFVEKVFQHQPKLRKRYRDGFFTDGHKLMWEYPRATPHGEQMDFVEVMELKEGLIDRHRVYGGWCGLKT